MSTITREPSRGALPPHAGSAAGTNPPHTPHVQQTPEYGLLAAVVALMLTASLPLARVFVGLSVLGPVVVAALAPLAINWSCRRRRLGPGLTLLSSLVGWAVFVSLVFLSDTLIAGLVPTLSTAREALELWLRGLELIQIRPSPAFPEAGLVFLAVNGVWAVSHAVDGLVFRLQSPITAIVLAMVLWTVPLGLAPPSPSAWLWAAPLLAAAGGLLLTSADSDLGRYGRWMVPGDPAGVRRRRNPLLTGGAVLAVCAIAIGSLVASSLPGYGQGPWYQLRALGGTTLTGNPIVSLQQNLVSQDTGPLLRVTSPRPLYIRTTSLDVYGEREEWTNDGITGQPVVGSIGLSAPLTAAEPARVTVEVAADLPSAVLVPLPYQTIAIRNSTVDPLRYDRPLATFTVDEERSLQMDDRFDVVAALPNPTSETLNSVPTEGVRTDPALTALPSGVVPPRVGELAREIVANAGATTQYEQALAIQNELRRWTYSLQVAPSHSGNALATFLETRIGYCEQFAAAMAVMLRELGVPARVTVGFTPGIPDDPGAARRGEETTYTVSRSNAHAWVEVLFPGYGWQFFEPTPRSDGNLLVPTPANLAPTTTLRQAIPESFDRAPEGPGDFLSQGNEAPGDLGNIPAPGQGAGAGSGAGAKIAGVPILLAVLAGLVGVGAVTGVAVARREPPPRSPVERVLGARRRVRRLGSGLSLPPNPCETDQEYLDRLVSERAGTPAEQRARVEAAATLLARRAGQAQWAPTLPDGAAEVAEAAAQVMEEELLDGLPAWRRTVVRTRANLPMRSR